MKKILLLWLMLSMSTVGMMAQDNTRVKNYFVGVQVNEDNSFSVYEEVLAHFAEPRHGFYRYLPYKYWLADTGKDYLCEIKELDVEGDQFDLSSEEGNLLIRIGDPDRTITGDKAYSIGYLLRNSDDRVGDRDLFYHSIIGKDFGLDIDTLSFTVVFEKPLPQGSAEKLKVMSGSIGSKTDELGSEVWMSGDTIYGVVYNVPQKNSLSLMLPLPEGYFVGEKCANPTLTYIFLAITAVLVILLLYFELTNHQPVVVSQIEFYPPEDMCSAELGTFIDDKVDNIDLASLIPWYASQGYVKLEEKEERGLFGKKTYLEMTKLKGCKGECKQYQRTFFSALFPGSETTVRLDKLAKADTLVAAAKKELEREFEGEHKLTTWHKAVWLLLPILVFSTLGLIAALPYDFMASDDWYAVAFLWATPAVMGALYVTGSAAGLAIESGWMKKSMFVVRLVVMLIVMSIHCWMFDDLQVGQPVIVAVYLACFAVVELCVRLNNDTEYRQQTLGKLIGLKEFIATAEEPRLRSLLEEDSAYFYRILPYAMVFGISNEWAEHFKHIEMEKPDWYSSTSSGVNSNFASHFVSKISSASDSAISCMSPSSSGSGGSGGGTGGGGGGAW